MSEYYPVNTESKKYNNELEELRAEVAELRGIIERHNVSIILLERNDKRSRSAISNLQNFFLGLFKKLLSKINMTPEENTNLLQWGGIKEVMCNNPDHLCKFSVKSITKYCGTDPTCTNCRHLEKHTP
jgi:hypothetical protein